MLLSQRSHCPNIEVMRLASNDINQMILILSQLTADVSLPSLYHLSSDMLDFAIHLIQWLSAALLSLAHIFFKYVYIYSANSISLVHLKFLHLQRKFAPRTGKKSS